MEPAFENPLLSSLDSRESASAAVFDQDVMLERLLEDHELAEMLIGVFLDDVPQQIVALARNLAAGDAATARRQAHLLKGAAGILSANRFSETAGLVEEAANSGEIPQAARYASELRERLQELSIAVSQSGLGSTVKKD